MSKITTSISIQVDLLHGLSTISEQHNISRSAYIQSLLASDPAVKAAASAYKAAADAERSGTHQGNLLVWAAAQQ